MNNFSEVRVRIAPSPTGFFHVGSARTALYNWLFARHGKGKFIVRVEDTDVARSSQEMTQVILKGLEWLGLNWDEGPYFQSRRLDIYNNYVKKLIEKNHAYYCYCDSEELEKEKQEAYKNKIDWHYDRRCLKLSETERAEKEKSNLPKAVRFLVPNHAVAFNDIVHGEIKREAQDIEDFIIMRANGIPTYNLACVIDDYKMRISHVIRGADHITNTPKQILLYEILELPKPEFAHLPLILGQDKSKLSKRHGAVSLSEYREKGFLPDAMVNYLSLLGWSPGDNQEIFMRRKISDMGTVDMNKLAAQFTLERINKANAVFDTTKLEWMNQQYIMQLPSSEFQKKIKPFITKSDLMTKEQIELEKKWYIDVCNLMQPRLKRLSDIGKQGRFLFKDDFEYDKDELNKYLDKKSLDIVKKILTELQRIEPYEAGLIEVRLRRFAEDHNVKVRELIHPLRAFVTGSSGGPPLFDTMELVGKERCVARIKKILDEYGDLNA